MKIFQTLQHDEKKWLKSETREEPDSTCAMKKCELHAGCENISCDIVTKLRNGFVTWLSTGEKEYPLAGFPVRQDFVVS